MATGAGGQIVPNAQATGWNVTEQQRTMGLDGRGQPSDGYEVYFVTAKQVRGSVFIPLSMYNPTNVRAQVAQHAYELDQVQGLTG